MITIKMSVTICDCAQVTGSREMIIIIIIFIIIIFVIFVIIIFVIIYVIIFIFIISLF